MTDTMPAQTQRTIDPDKLMSFVFRAVDEVGATLNTALVVMGDKLGYYTVMADGRPVTPAELAERTRTSEHYAREWLNNQAAGAIVEYDAETRRYTLPAEHAVALASDQHGPSLGSTPGGSPDARAGPSRPGSEATYPTPPRGDAPP